MIKTNPQDMWQERQNDIDYKAKMGFSTKWPENIRFIEGNQWPKPTEMTKYMPRPVINQCDFIIENKQSNILAQSLKMVFSPGELPAEGDTTGLSQAAEDYTDAAANTWDDIDQDSLNEDAVNDTLSVGTGVYHYYWDNNAKGGQFTAYVGKMCGEIIDPMNVILGNPKLKPSETQKQPFIMIETQEDTDLLIEAAKKNGSNWHQIQPDKDKSNNNKYDNDKVEVEGARTTTALTKYYKENGQTYWTKVTEMAVVQKPRPLTPDGSNKPFEIYPIEILSFKRRKKCTFGRSIIEDIIPNQKALNWGLGMMLLSVQQTAWPKIIAKVGALLQSVTNEPGEIITDNLGTPGVDGIKYMQPPNFSTMPILLSDKILEMTRQITGTTEVSSGEVIGANMAAAAIIALQEQAKKPNEGYQNKVYRSIKNIGRIYEEFYKCYHNNPVPIPSKDENGNDITKTFIGSQYAGMSFGLKIDVGPASVFSESLQVTVLDKMFDKGALDKYQYVKYLPKNVVSQELAHDFEKEYEQVKEQQAIQGQTDNVLSGLSPDELAHLKQNPQLLDEAMASMGGGNAGQMQG